MFRTLRIKDASVEVQEGQPVTSPPPGEKCWIDLGDFGSAELEFLREEFQFHPLAIEDCNTPDQRAKAEEYGDHLFIVIHALTLGAGNGTVLEDEQVAAFLGERYLVTVHRKPIKQLGVDPTVVSPGAIWFTTRPIAYSYRDRIDHRD
jgi:Mg2+ and Co2+ transporter CorA